MGEIATISVAEALELWKGGAAMSRLKKEHKWFKLPDGSKTHKLRTAITELVGGKEAFEALRAAGAGGHAVGGPRGPVVPKPPADDTGVPVVTATPTKSGWRVRYLPSMKRVLCAPDGTEYVEAATHEKAALVHHSKMFGVTRWKVLPPMVAPPEPKKKGKRGKAAPEDPPPASPAKAKRVRRKH